MCCVECTVHNVWGWVVNGVDCSYAHIVKDSQALGAVAVDAINNVATFVVALFK